MTDHVQPDLFGDLDREEEQAQHAQAQAAERTRLFQQPATCPSCGTHEPSGYLLRNNHGVEPGTEGVCGFPPGRHPIFGAMCTAQHLVTNHITYCARREDPEALAERQQRGRELGLDVEAITRRARADVEQDPA